MSPARLLLGGVLATACALVIAWASQAPTTYARADDALLRLSWRVDGVRVEECRERTPEELEALAPHMRTPRVCVGGGADYELTVELDGRAIRRDTLAAGGARGDRPIYVHQDLDIEPGRHDIRVVFEALTPDDFDAAGRVLSYRFEEAVTVAPTEVILIGLDPVSGRLSRIVR